MHHLRNLHVMHIPAPASAPTQFKNVKIIMKKYAPTHPDPLSQAHTEGVTHTLCGLMPAAATYTSSFPIGIPIP